MDALLPYLSAHPLIALALVLVLVGIVASIVKKLVKIALILLIIFAVAGGTVFHISQKDLAEKGRTLFEKAKETGGGLLEDAGRTVGREVKKRAHELTADDSTTASDTAHAPKAHTAKPAARPARQTGK